MRRPARLADAGPVSWTRGELIGAGAFGRVYLGLNNDTGQLMAVKQARAAALCRGQDGMSTKRSTQLGAVGCSSLGPGP